MTTNIEILSLDHVSEKSSIEYEYPNFNDKFNSNLFSGLEDEDGGYEFPSNNYSSEYENENSSSLMPIPPLPTDKYKT